MLESFVKESSKNFLQVIENEQVYSKSHLDKPLKPLKIRNYEHFWKALLETEKCNFKIENTKIKIQKSEINLRSSQFYVWISILYRLLNFDFRFWNYKTALQLYDF